MNLRNILEGYETSCKVLLTGGVYDIYSNPSLREVNQVSKEMNGIKSIRFIAHSLKETIFVFSPDLLHGQAVKKIEKDCNKKLGLQKSMMGTASFLEGVWKINREETKGPFSEEAIEKMNGFINKSFLRY